MNDISGWLWRSFGMFKTQWTMVLGWDHVLWIWRLWNSRPRRGIHTCRQIRAMDKAYYFCIYAWWMLARITVKCQPYILNAMDCSSWYNYVSWYPIKHKQQHGVGYKDGRTKEVTNWSNVMRQPVSDNVKQLRMARQNYHAKIYLLRRFSLVNLQLDLPNNMHLYNNLSLGIRNQIKSVWPSYGVQYDDEIHIEVANDRPLCWYISY